MAKQHTPKNTTKSEPKTEKKAEAKSQSPAQQDPSFNGNKPAVPETRRKAQQVKTMLEKSRDQIVAALAGQMDPDRFLRVCLTSYQTGSDLMEAEPVTFIGAIIQAAQLGLSVDPLLGEAYLIARWNRHTRTKQVHLMIGYQGLMKRVMRTSRIASIDADVVYANDEFEVVKGAPDSHIIHKPTIVGDPGAIVATYAIAKFRDGGYVFWVCPLWEIESAKSRSDAGKKNSGPWKSDYAAMAMKTAIRRLCKLLPIDDVTKAQLSKEDREETLDVDFRETAKVSQAPKPKTVQDLLPTSEEEPQPLPEPEEKTEEREAPDEPPPPTDDDRPHED